MRRFLLIVVSITLLALLFCCRPPEGPMAERRGERGGGAVSSAGDSNDPGSMLSQGKLGKEDYAKIRGELDCVTAHFEGEEAAKKAALASIYQRYGTTAEWVEGVDNYTASSPYNPRIVEFVNARKQQLCPNGKLQPEFLTLITP